MADMLEVLAALAGLHDATVDDIIALAAKKRCERGGFGNRLWLETADANPAPSTRVR
ncbi:hypothetical protein ACAG26_02880 [Mycobacterium sp. pUA109]|uniref:hypothetical protein n=1 Tax=Mycobacterium sp. pUA109 TaxID=3238982 RepID=UPI00351B222F